MSETSNAKSRDEKRQKDHQGIRINAGIKRKWWATPKIFAILRELSYCINKTSKKCYNKWAGKKKKKESRQVEDICRGLGKGA